MEAKCIFVRAKVEPALERMATASYAVFVHLAACHQQLRSKPGADLFAAEGVYSFYSRLYSVQEALLDEFLPAVETVTKRFSKRYVSSDRDPEGNPKKNFARYETRLEKNGRAGLYRETKAAFRQANLYRNQRVHGWGLPAQSGRVPGPKYLHAWIGKGLGELARADEERIAREFVRALPQARKDLKSIELILDEIRTMALGELADFRTPLLAKTYQKAQAPKKNERLPSWWRTTKSLSAAAVVTSGSVTTIS